MKSRRMKWVGHVAHMGNRKDADRVLVVRPEENNNLKVRGVDGRIILKCVFKKYNEVVWTGLIWLRIRTAGAFF